MADIARADIELLTTRVEPQRDHSHHPTRLGDILQSDWFRRFKAMNRNEVEIEDEKTGKVKEVPILTALPPGRTKRA